MRTKHKGKVLVTENETKAEFSVPVKTNGEFRTFVADIHRQQTFLG